MIKLLRALVQGVKPRMWESISDVVEVKGRTLCRTDGRVLMTATLAEELDALPECQVPIDLAKRALVNPGGYLDDTRSLKITQEGDRLKLSTLAGSGHLLHAVEAPVEDQLKFPRWQSLVQKTMAVEPTASVTLWPELLVAALRAIAAMRLRAVTLDLLPDDEKGCSRPIRLTGKSRDGDFICLVMPMLKEKKEPDDDQD